jgi:integral membrane protein
MTKEENRSISLRQNLSVLTKSNLISFLRWSALLEGISLLVLLFVAMPVKYALDKPLMVQVVGMAHGVLFILYSVLLAAVALKMNWLGRKAIISFFASFVPFGTFYVDKHYFKALAERAKSLD